MSLWRRLYDGVATHRHGRVPRSGYAITLVAAVGVQRVDRSRGPLTALAVGLLVLILSDSASGVDSSWAFDEGTGTVAHDSVGGNDLTLSGVTWVSGHLGYATSYNGTSSYASGTVDLSGTSVITVAFWMKWNTWANDDKEAMEYTATWYSNTAFVIDPNGSSGNFEVQVHGNAGFNGVLFARPSVGVWHHYAFVLDFSQASNEVVPYVDGAAVTYTHQWTANNTNSWVTQADNVLYVMSRGGTNCFGAGALDQLKIYKSSKTPAQIAALAEERRRGPVGVGYPLMH